MDAVKNCGVAQKSLIYSNAQKFWRKTEQNK